MKAVLFYWSKGAETRRDLIKIISDLNERNKPCYLSILARKLKMSHVAVKKHIDLLIEYKYVKSINPKGKPSYLRLSRKGKEVADEFSRK